MLRGVWVVCQGGCRKRCHTLFKDKIGSPLYALSQQMLIECPQCASHYSRHPAMSKTAFVEHESDIVRCSEVATEVRKTRSLALGNSWHSGGDCPSLH